MLPVSVSTATVEDRTTITTGTELYVIYLSCLLAYDDVRHACIVGFCPQ